MNCTLKVGVRTKNYRLEFALVEGALGPMITIATITELSNHYK